MKNSKLEKCFTFKADRINWLASMCGKLTDLAARTALTNSHTHRSSSSGKSIFMRTSNMSVNCFWSLMNVPRLNFTNCSNKWRYREKYLTFRVDVFSKASFDESEFAFCKSTANCIRRMNTFQYTFSTCFGWISSSMAVRKYSSSSDHNSKLAPFLSTTSNRAIRN